MDASLSRYKSLGWKTRQTALHKMKGEHLGHYLKKAGGTEGVARSVQCLP